MSKHFITITDENLYNDIVEYCKLNNEKINTFCQRILKEQLLIEKYGDTPFGNIVEKINVIPEVTTSEPEVVVEKVVKEIKQDKIEEIENNDSIQNEVPRKKIRRL